MLLKSCTSEQRLLSTVEASFIRHCTLRRMNHPLMLTEQCPIRQNLTHAALKLHWHTQESSLLLSLLDPDDCREAPMIRLAHNMQQRVLPFPTQMRGRTAGSLRMSVHSV